MLPLPPLLPLLLLLRPLRREASSTAVDKPAVPGMALPLLRVLKTGIRNTPLSRLLLLWPTPFPRYSNISSNLSPLPWELLLTELFP